MSTQATDISLDSETQTPHDDRRRGVSGMGRCGRTKVSLIKLRHRAGRPYALRWREGGRQRQLTVGADRRTAERARAQREAELNGWALPRQVATRSLDELAEAYLSACAGRLAPRAVKEYELVIGRFLRHLRTTRTAASVTPIAAEQYISDRLSEVRPATADKALRALRRWWHWLIDHDQAQANPWQRVTRPRVVPRPHPVLSVEQCGALLRECAKRDRMLAAAVAVALDVGLRIGELANLRPCDVDAASRRLRVQAREGWTTKSNRDRVTVLTPSTAARLATVLNGQPYVLAGTNRAAWQKRFRKELKAACLAAGVPVLTPHDLRRTAATCWAECVPMHVLNAAFGWRSSQTAATYYVRIDAEAAAEKAAALRLEKFGDFLDKGIDKADGNHVDSAPQSSNPGVTG